MKRTVRAFHLWIAVVAVMGLGLLLIPSRIEKALEEERGFSRQEGSRVGTVYRLSSSRWTDFRIQDVEQPIKIVTNANVPAELFGTDRFKTTYAVHYQVVSASGVLLKEATYALRSRFLSRMGEGDERPVPAQYYVGGTQVPLASRTVYLDLRELERKAVTLRLRFAWAGEHVKDVVIRVYQKETVPEYKFRYLWRRLSLETKERLARANIYTTDLLTEWERRNLLENRWSPLGPQGFEGRDYESTKLYTLGADGSTTLGEQLAPHGVLAGNGLVGVVPLPEHFSCVRLEFERMAWNDPRPTTAQVTWLGWEGAAREDVLVELRGEKCEHAGEFDPGMLEIRCDVPIVARAYLSESTGEIDITPPAEYAVAFALRDTEPLEYVNTLVGEVAMPLRVDIRRMRGDEPAAAPSISNVRYQILNARDETVASGALPHSGPLSPYDSLPRSTEDDRVSEPSRHYFFLRPEAAKIRFLSSDPSLLLAVYTRPDTLERFLMVPEKRRRWESGQEAERDWFYVKPINYSECVWNRRELLLRVQARPPLPSEAVALGRYSVQSYLPTDGGRAYSILDALTYTDGPGAVSAPGLTEIPANQRVVVEVLGTSGAVRNRVRVICTKASAGLADVTLWVDGRLHSRERISGFACRIAPPPLPTGRHTIEWSCPEDARFYVEDIESGPARRFLERTAYFLDESGLTFRIPKGAGETRRLLLRYFPSIGDLESEGGLLPRVDIRTIVADAVKPTDTAFDSWTFPHSVYSLRLDQREWFPVIGRDGAFVAGSTAALLTLGSDIAGGDRELRVALDRGPPGFLQLVEIVPGTEAELSAFSESAPPTDSGDLE